MIFAAILPENSPSAGISQVILPEIPSAIFPVIQSEMSSEFLPMATPGALSEISAEISHGLLEKKKKTCGIP